MKKAILILSFLWINIYGHAQVNYHFCDEPGTIIETYPPRFDGYPGNWQRSHGSPSWGKSVIFMWHKSGHNAGEGIYQDDAFPVKGNYKIKIGLREAPDRGIINVFSAVGLVPYTLANDGSAIPTPANQKLLKVWNTGVVTSGVTTEWVINDVHNPFDHGQIWIYPEQTDIDDQSQCLIDYVIICQDLDGKIYFYGVLEPGTTYRDFFLIGSSLPLGSGVITNDAAESTDYVGKRFIEILPSTSITSSGTGHFFIGRIGSAPSFCLQAQDCSDIESFARETADKEDNNIFSNRINISPNPNQGSFQLSVPGDESYDISVSSMLGSTVYQAKVSGALKHTISIPELIPGTYVVTISNGLRKEVKKMVVIK